LDRSSHALDEHVQTRIAYFVSSITILTLMINGSIIGYIYKALQIYPKPKAHTSLLQRAFHRVEGIAASRIRRLEHNWFFHNSFLDLVMEAVPKMDKPDEKKLTNDEIAESLNGNISQLSVTEFVTEVMLRAKDGVNTDTTLDRYASKMKKKSGDKNPFVVGGGLLTGDDVDDIVGQTICMTLKQSEHKRPKKDLDEPAMDASKTDDRAITRPVPCFRPGRTAQDVCISSLASININVDLSRNGSRGRLPKFGINARNDECELRHGTYFCGRNFDTGTGRSSASLKKEESSANTKCQAVAGLQCASCLEFSNAITNCELGWGPMTLDERQRIVARKRWKHVRKNVRKVVRVKMAINKDVATIKTRAFNTDNLVENTDEFNAEDVIRDDISMAEVYATILNAIHVRVNQMHEMGTLPTDAYLVFLDAMENGMDAINGELGDERFLKGTYLEGLHAMEQHEQMKASIHVVWRSMLWMTDSRSRRWWDFIELFANFPGVGNIIKCHNWVSVLRNTELVLSFIFIVEAFLEEEGTKELIKDFPFIKRSLKTGVTLAKAEFLYKLQEECPGVFIAAEHILALRTVVQEKKHIVHHFAQVGMISPAESENMIHAHLEPLLKKLSSYSPTLEQIRIAQSFNADEYSPSRKLYKNLLFTVTQKNKPNVFFQKDSRTSVHLNPKPLLDALGEVGIYDKQKSKVALDRPESPRMTMPSGSPHSR